MKCTAIDKQRRLIRRIRADLLKEEARHRRDGNGVAASDCEGQANGLDGVLESLETLKQYAIAIAEIRIIPVER